MTEKRWQDWAMLVFGLWLFFAPYFLIYHPPSGVAAWNSSVLGAAVTVFAISALVVPEKWEEWVNLALGLWLIAAPFALQFYQTEAVATWNQIILGVLIDGGAIWVLAQRPTLSPA